MRLSWRDVATTVLAIFGGVVTYAKFYDYSWAVIGGSWKSAVAVLGITGLAMALVSGFDYANRSILNITEMVLGVVALGVAVAGVIVASPTLFYILAATLGALWLIDVARHAWHSVSETDTTSTYGRHAPVH